MRVASKLVIISMQVHHTNGREWKEAVVFEKGGAK